MTFKGKFERRPVKQIGGKIGPRETVAGVGIAAALACFGPGFLPPGVKPAVTPRDPEVARGNRIRESARGEQCTVRLVGVCTFDPATTIWSHARWGAQLGDAGRGMATKALDVCGAYSCTACDAVYDGQATASHLTRLQIDMDWCLGHFRSLGRLSVKGLL